MGVFADVIEEYRGASPGGKILMIVAVVAVAGLGLYAYKQHQQGNSQPSAGTLVPIDLSGSGGSTGSSQGATTTPTTTPTSTPPILPGPNAIFRPSSFGPGGGIFKPVNIPSGGTQRIVFPHA